MLDVPVRASLPVVLVALAGLLGCGAEDRVAGDTEDQAEIAGRELVRSACPGRPAPRITRCTAQRDAWRCDYTSLSGRNSVVVKDYEDGSLLSIAC